MNKTFAHLSKEIDHSNYLESVQKAFINKRSYQRFPNDEEFCQAFVIKDVYNFRSRNYLLLKLENYGHPADPLSGVGDLTIEHILPQNKNLSLQWRTELGKDWEQIQARYLHTIGNLTLTEYNSMMSDRSFIEKRDLKNEDNKPIGFSGSHLYLNKELGRFEFWNESLIKERASHLADDAARIWKFPKF